ncbi:Caspase-10 [Saguinus oedipus]|uniref:Caspase-10 n=1 Tax=Saguinus oedipus TaxID=9490 RepID=A0ABQ9VJ22_SAGOE|nr:Caspase-10 [Saguinus oedipus]
MSSQGPHSDKNCKGNFREKLLIIGSNLGVEDVEHLKFLLIDLVPHKKLEKSSSASDVFEQLLAEDLLSESNPFFLAELLYIIGQKKLLQYLNYTKEKVEHLLPAQRKVSLFSSEVHLSVATPAFSLVTSHHTNLLYELSESIDKEKLKDMIFLLGDSLPKTEMTSLGLMAFLEKQDKIDEDNLTDLEDLCKMVVPNLLRNIEKYKREKVSDSSVQISFVKNETKRKLLSTQIVIPPVDKEAESLYQGEEELFSQTEVKTFLEALPEESWQNKHGRSDELVTLCVAETAPSRAGAFRPALTVERAVWVGVLYGVLPDVDSEGEKKQEEGPEDDVFSSLNPCSEPKP